MGFALPIGVNIGIEYQDFQEGYHWTSDPHPSKVMGRMKERYFTPETVTAKASELRSRVGSLIHLRRRTFQPERSALLALDLQRYFFDPTSHAFIPSAPAILPGLRSIINAYRVSGLPVHFTRHLNTAEDAGMMTSWWKELITSENPLSCILTDLDTRGQAINKSQYDAFYQTDLETILQRSGVRQVLIGGVMAHLCCETTARSAFMHGFEAFVLVDGMATYNEQLHFATLLNLSHGFATPLLSSEALAALHEHAMGSE
jgi:isochorismate hydrolase